MAQQNDGKMSLPIPPPGNDALATNNELGSLCQKCGSTDTDTENAAPDRRCSITDKCVEACEAYGRVCPCYARAAGKAACRAMMKMSEETNVFVGKPSFPRFDPDDLVIGKLLGEGGFSEVHEVRTLARPKWRLEEGIDADDGDKDGVEEKKVETDETQGDADEQIYAVKYLKRPVMVDRHNFERGAADLAIEARFLSALNHPHVVKLHGIAAGSVESNVAKGKECGFFIVIDRLYDTLEDRIETWAEEMSKYNSLLYRTRHDYHGLKRRALLTDRLEVAMDIASTLQHLHSHNIIYRDLKPDNLGFDSNGTIKMFDFGLAKELKASKLAKDGPGNTYNLSGNTGSRRYMAPEVARSIPYGLSADIFSFGILLYEICTLEKPFQGYSAFRHQDEVVKMKMRPRIETNGAHSFWHSGLASLIQLCWSDDPRERPELEEVLTKLKQFITDESAQEGNETGSRQEEQQQVDEEAKSPGRKPSISPPRGGFGSIKKPAKATRGATWSSASSEESKAGLGSITRANRTRGTSWGLRRSKQQAPEVV